MELVMQKVCRDEEETRLFAEEFALLLKPGDVVAMTGNLGAGKTLFVKSVCEKINAKDISSPTFAIVNEYIGDMKFYHFDFYRIENAEELYDIGFEDYLNDEESVMFIEWAEMFDDILPKKRYNIMIEHSGQSERKITIERQ